MGEVGESWGRLGEGMLGEVEGSWGRLKEVGNVREVGRRLGEVEERFGEVEGGWKG